MVGGSLGLGRSWTKSRPVAMVCDEGLKVKMKMKMKMKMEEENILEVLVVFWCDMIGVLWGYYIFMVWIGRVKVVHLTTC